MDQLPPGYFTISPGPRRRMCGRRGRQAWLVLAVVVLATTGIAVARLAGGDL